MGGTHLHLHAWEERAALGRLCARASFDSSIPVLGWLGRARRPRRGGELAVGQPVGAQDASQRANRAMYRLTRGDGSPVCGSENWCAYALRGLGGTGTGTARGWGGEGVVPGNASAYLCTGKRETRDQREDGAGVCQCSTRSGDATKSVRLFADGR